MNNNNKYNIETIINDPFLAWTPYLISLFENDLTKNQVDKDLDMNQIKIYNAFIYGGEVIKLDRFSN